MKQIAIYGKGSIGKSTVASHLSYALASRGKRVLQVGCDPQSDSTHNLTAGNIKPILGVLAEHDFDCEDIEVDEIVHESRLKFDSGGSIYCAEAGGPDPGVGGGRCADNLFDFILLFLLHDQTEAFGRGPDPELIRLPTPVLNRALLTGFAGIMTMVAAVDRFHFAFEWPLDQLRDPQIRLRGGGRSGVLF